MAIAKFLPTWMGGEADRVDGGGARLSVPSSSAAQPAAVSAGSPGQPVTTAVQVSTCGWCGGYHSGTCPKVKAIELPRERCGQARGVQRRNVNVKRACPHWWGLFWGWLKCHACGALFIPGKSGEEEA